MQCQDPSALLKLTTSGKLFLWNDNAGDSDVDSDDGDSDHSDHSDSDDSDRGARDGDSDGDEATTAWSTLTTA